MANTPLPWILELRTANGRGALAVLLVAFLLEVLLLLLGMLVSVLLESTHCSQVQGKNALLLRFGERIPIAMP
jgi:hypothetical protein